MSCLNRLLLIADSGPGIGWGHLSRMIAVGQAWRRNNRETYLLTYDLPEWARRHCRESGIHSGEVKFACAKFACATSGLLANLSAQLGIIQPDVICIDGYRFGDSMGEVLREHCQFLVSFDDFGHATHRHSDLIVNANLYGTAESYPSLRGKLLTGRRHVVLREEFLIARAPGSTTRSMASGAASGLAGLRVLVSLGGSATPSTWRIVLRSLALANLPSGTAIDLLIGGMVTKPEAGLSRNLWEQLDPQSQSAFVSRNIQMVDHTADENIPLLLEKADLAVAASGSTLNELAFMGVPTVAFATAENQIAVGQAFHHFGAIQFLTHSLSETDSNLTFQNLSSNRPGTNESKRRESSFVEELSDRICALANDPEFRRRLSQRARELIDGLGAARVARRMSMGRIRIRPVCWDDWRELLSLRNDEVVRRNSYSPEVVLEQTHREWLANKLNDSSARIWAIEGNRSKFLGQVRLDWTADRDQAQVGLALCAEARGLGLAESALALVEIEARQLGLKRLEALIKLDNVASLKSFERAGYVHASSRADLPEGSARMALILTGDGQPCVSPLRSEAFDGLCTNHEIPIDDKSPHATLRLPIGS